MSKVVTVIVIVLIFFSPSAAFCVDGNKLLSNCQQLVRLGLNTDDMTNGEIVSATFCKGFLTGIVNLNCDLEEAGHGPGLLCIPAERVTATQAARVVVKYLEDNPKDLYLNGSLLAFVALMKAFPCR